MGRRGAQRRHRYEWTTMRDCIFYCESLAENGEVGAQKLASEAFKLPRSCLTKWLKKGKRQQI
eukprot:1965424-Lingulodinium_polyedra.AAC.1